MAMLDEAREEAAVALLVRGAVTVREAQARFGVGRAALYKAMNAGHLPWTQMLGCKSRLIPILAIERLLAQGMKGPI